jgi:hypothetical protein
MNKKKFPQQVVSYGLILLFLVGCSAPSTPPPTLIPHTATPNPPTDTPIPPSPTPKPLSVKDLIPSVNLENESQVRIIVMVNQSGELISISRWPSHSQALLIGGLIIYLESGGTMPFSVPPEDLELEGPSPNFTGEWASVDWFSGAEHIISGTIRVNGYVFDSDPAYPLTFKVVTDAGYVYLLGKGKVTTPLGEEYHLGLGDTVDLWIDRASSSNQLEREAAAQALGYLILSDSEADKQTVVETLMKLLHDKAFEVRRNAIEALVRIGEIDAIPSLEKISETDDNEWVKLVAAWAITELEGK